MNKSIKFKKLSLHLKKNLWFLTLKPPWNRTFDF